MALKCYNILFSLGSYNQGGAERQAVNLAEWFLQKGHKVSFTAFSPEGPVKNRLNELGLQANHRSFDFFFIDNLKKMQFTKSAFSYKKKHHKLLKEYAQYINDLGAEIIMPFTFYPNVVCSGAFPYTAAKCCIWNQRDIRVDGMRGFYLEKKAVHNASFIVSNSYPGLQEVSKVYDVSSSKMSVIRNAVPVPVSDELIPYAHPDFIEGSLKVVMLGNFQPNKDHQTIIKAWSLLKKKSAEKNIQLILAGRFSGSEHTLMSLCAELNLAVGSDVVFVNAVKEVNRLLSTCHIAALSSHEEGSPNAVLEAMACGLPVVATNIDACKVALGNDYLFLSSPGDAGEMADNFARLIADEKLRKTVGDLNLNRIKVEFSPELAGSSFLKLFQQFAG